MNKATPFTLFYDMKHLLTFLFGLVTMTAPAQTGSKDKDAVLTAEKARFAAQITQNYATLDQLLGDELFYQHSNGDVDNKTTFIQSIKDGKRRYESIMLDSSTVRIYGNTAIINGICSYTQQFADGTPNNRKLRYTDVWVKRGRRWQLVSWQAHKIDKTPVYFMVD